jgi:hypothetical protein
MSGYYPEGVTGAELAIAGPDTERETKRDVSCKNDECEHFEEEFDAVGIEWTYRHDGYFDWKCYACGKEHQEWFDADEEYGPDPDDLRDAYYGY